MYLKITSRRIKFPKALDFNVYALELLMKDKNLVISMIGRELRTLIICLGTKYFVHIRGTHFYLSSLHFYKYLCLVCFFFLNKNQYIGSRIIETPTHHTCVRKMTGHFSVVLVSNVALSDDTSCCIIQFYVIINILAKFCSGSLKIVSSFVSLNL